MVKIFDNIVYSYIKHIIFPRILDINKPGFIFEDFTKVGSNTILKVIFLPETLLANLEIELKNYSKALYCIGKKFAYYYSGLANLLRLGGKNFLTFANIYLKFVEGMQSSGFHHRIDLKDKLFELRMKNYIICRKNGLGYILPSGGVAGIWAYMMKDKTVEAVHPKCQGRGDEEGLVIAAPYNKLKELGYNSMVCTNLIRGKLTEEYKYLNSYKDPKYARYSLKDLIDSKIFEYKFGQLLYRSERFFLCGLELLYFLEMELKKINKLGTLWKVSFDFGRKFARISGKQDPKKLIMDIFPALGFGDILVLKRKGKYEVFIDYFPWLEFWKSIDYTLIRGLFSGIISEYEGKDIKLLNVEKDISQGYLSLWFSE